MPARALLVGEVLGVRRTAMDHVGLPGIGAIAPYPGFRPVQQVGQDLGVVHVGGRGHHRMDELGFTVHPDVGLHAEIPLVSLLGLMHLGVARFRLVLGRARGVDDRGIDDGAAGDAKATGGEVRIHQRKDLFTETVRLQPMAKLFIYFIEVLVAFLQAFIFTMLTAVFIGQAFEGSHADVDHHADEVIV